MAAKVQIIVEAKDQTGGAFRSIMGSFTEIRNAIDLAGMALQKMKQGYDFAREGAQLDFTANKFDRLARTIGTTGDALLGKMRDATRGTLSDFEAMAAATDILSLGLTQNERDTIRLAKVQSGLAMDTNQLVLALTNQTTMRFDQLGVSVAGFEDKVKSLTAAGMSAQEAFTEAFLQQAEQQLEKVGNAADESLGSFMQFEAQLKNLKDEAKMAAGEGLAPLVKWLGEGMASMRMFKEALAEANPELYEQYQSTRTVTAEMQRVVDEYQRAAQYGKAWEQALEEQNTALAENNIQTKLTEEQLKAMNERNQQFIGVLGQTGDALTTFRDGMAEVDAKLAEGEITVDEHKAKVAELKAEYEDASARIVQSIVAMKLATDGWTDAELTAYLNISKGLGLITDDQIHLAQTSLAAADKLVAMQDPLLHTGQRAQDAAGGLDSLGESATSLVDLLNPATAAASGLKSALAKLPPSGTAWYYDIFIKTHGRATFSLPSIGEGQGYQTGVHVGEDSGRQSGGEVYAGRPYMVGERGPEPFIPAQNGRILGHAEALHAMTLGGGGGNTNYFYGPVTISGDAEAGRDIMSIR